MTSLPIVCTLSPTELAIRLARIRTLSRDALRGHERADLRLLLHYDVNAGPEVRAMVAAEQQCCAFLTFDIAEDSSGVHVTIEAPEHARAAADELFEQFISG
jgi:hypothetical protein